MHYSFNRWLISLTILISTSLLQLEAQGLLFNGNDKLIEERTSYNVFEDKKLKPIETKLNVDYKISIYAKKSFGYIFQLFDLEDNLAYSLTYEHNDSSKKGFFKLNEEGEGNLITLEFDDNELGYNKWLDTKISINLISKTLSLQIDSKYKIVALKNVKAPLKMDLHFGKYKHMVDVASFILKDLRIEVNDKETNYQFPFTESNGKTVHNLKSENIGLVENPVWQMTKSFHWENVFSKQYKAMSSVCFDQKNQNFIILDQNAITIFNVLSRETTERKYNNDLPFNILLGSSFVDTVRNRVYLYEINSLPLESSTIAYLDLAQLEWHAISHKQHTMQIHHHDGFFNAKDETYLIFGGFGNKKYSNTFLRLNLKTDTWDTLPIETNSLTPRYFSGMAVSPSNDALYIYGGMGNESGDQTIGRKYYYDLHRVDLKKNKVTKLWTREKQEPNTVSVRNMIMNSDSTFLTLCYPEHISRSYLLLYQFSLNRASDSIQLGDSIKFISEKIETNANLYYSNETKQLYCSIIEYNNNGSSQVKVYAINYPPVTRNDVETTSTEDSENTIDQKALILIAIMVATMAFLNWLKNKQKRKEKKESKGKIQNSKESEFQLEDLVSPPITIDIKQNAIYLFGTIVIYDRKGKEISYMFSNRLKNALRLILYYTVTKGGISPHELNLALWPDNKDEVSLKNLRNVTISQLRKRLTELDGVNLLFENNLFFIVLEEQVTCDYYYFMQSLHNINKEEYLSLYLPLLERGTYQPFDYDSQILNDIYNNTTTLIRNRITTDLEYTFNHKKDYHLSIRMANILSSYFSLDETALFFIINAYHRLGYEHKAKNAYILFLTKYRQQNKSDYTTTFESILQISY